MEFTSFSNVGEREINEDCCGIATHDDSFCFVVADGLGGHGGGEIASKIAVNTVCSLFENDGYSDKFFNKAFALAQKEILEEQIRTHSPSRMKTTLVILIIHKGYAYWGHVGDSRLYYLKNKKFKQRTIDHSVPQMLAISGQIKDSEIRHHPDRNRLMRVMGIKGEQPRYEVGKPVKISGSVAFLLCTDGYWELVEDADIVALLSASNTVEEWIIQMNEIVRQNGKGTNMDNFTAIAVWDKKKGLFG